MSDQKRCEMPPAGWTCSRGAGHDGPCAASPEPNVTKYERAVLDAMFRKAIVQRDEALAERDALLADVDRLTKQLAEAQTTIRALVNQSD